jgi:chemotaxis signal transduction protein
VKRLRETARQGPVQPIARAQRYVVFRVGAAMFAVAMDDVLEIGPAPRTTPLPGMPAAVRGLANVRGEAVCVVDLAAWTACASAPGEQGVRMLLVRDAGSERTAGLLVDEVLDVSLLAPVEPDAELAGPLAACLRGACEFEGKRAGVLNLGRMLRPDVVGPTIAAR